LQATNAPLEDQWPDLSGLPRAWSSTLGAAMEQLRVQAQRQFTAHLRSVDHAHHTCFQVDVWSEVGVNCSWASPGSTPHPAISGGCGQLSTACRRPCLQVERTVACMGTFFFESDKHGRGINIVSLRMSICLRKVHEGHSLRVARRSGTTNLCFHVNKHPEMAPVATISFAIAELGCIRSRCRRVPCLSSSRQLPTTKSARLSSEQSSLPM